MNFWKNLFHFGGDWIKGSSVNFFVMFIFVQTIYHAHTTATATKSFHLDLNELRLLVIP